MPTGSPSHHCQSGRGLRPGPPVTAAGYEALRARAEAAGPLVPAPEPMIAEVGKGWTVWERQAPEADYWPRGGLVWDVEEVTHVDTGERVIVFYVVGQGDASNARGRLRLHLLRRDQVASFEPPSSKSVLEAKRLLTREMAKCSPERERELGEVYCRLRGL